MCISIYVTFYLSFARAVVEVIYWSANTPSTPTIRVQLLLILVSLPICCTIVLSEKANGVGP